MHCDLQIFSALPSPSQLLSTASSTVVQPPSHASVSTGSTRYCRRPPESISVYYSENDRELSQDELSRLLDRSPADPVMVERILEMFGQPTTIASSEVTGRRLRDSNSHLSSGLLLYYYYNTRTETVVFS